MEKKKKSAAIHGVSEEVSGRDSLGVTQVLGDTVGAGFALSITSSEQNLGQFGWQMLPLPVWSGEGHWIQRLTGG